MSAPNCSRTASRKLPSAGSLLRHRRGFTLLEILAVMVILSLISASLFTIFKQGSDTWRLSGARTEAYLKARQILEMMAREIKGAVLITTARGPESYLQSERYRNRGFRADFRGFDSRDLPDWRTDRQLYSDQVFFVAPVTNSGRQELCMLGYWIKDEEDPKTGTPPTLYGLPTNAKDDILMRSYLTDGGPGDPNDVWRTFDFTDSVLNSPTLGELATSVRHLDIKYYDYEDASGSNRRLKEYDQWDSRPTSFPCDSQARGTTLTKDDDDKLPVAVKITVAVGDKDDVIKPIRLSTIVYLENAVRR
jgi:prepilin-type N-terminal cleavage/methylation domain-containing protein